jgi:hypothetical protein
MGVDQQRHRRAERQCDVWNDLWLCEGEACHPTFSLKVAPRSVEYQPEAAELRRDDNDGGNDKNINHDVFDERDQRRRAQTALVGVERENQKRRRERKVRQHPLAVEAEGVDDLFHPHELQCNVGHGRENASEGDGEPQPFVSISPDCNICGRDVPARVRDGPESWKDCEKERVEQDRVWYGEVAESSHTIDNRGHRDDCIGGVKIAADKEPRHPRTEAAPSQAPFVQLVEIA